MTTALGVYNYTKMNDVIQCLYYSWDLQKLASSWMDCNHARLTAANQAKLCILNYF